MHDQLIANLVKTVIESLDNDTLLHLVKDRGIEIATAKPLKDMNEEELAKATKDLDDCDLDRVLQTIHSDILWHALGEDQGLWNMLYDSNSFVLEELQNNALDYLSEFTTRDLRDELKSRTTTAGFMSDIDDSDLLEELRCRGTNLADKLSNNELLDEVRDRGLHRMDRMTKEELLEEIGQALELLRSKI